MCFFFFFQAEDGIRDIGVTGVQTCALPISLSLPIGGLVVSRWNAAYPDAGATPLGLAAWQAAFLAVGIPGLLLALWVLTLREPQRGASDGLPQPIVRPNAWRDFGQELLAILPPLTLINVAR